MNSENLDIIVVGAGMVGLTAALALHNSGFNILVIEGRDDQFLSLPGDLKHIGKSAEILESYDCRVSALTKASENIFKNLGVWENILKMRTSPYHKMTVWDGEGTGNVNFTSDELYEDNLGYIVENSVVVAALLETAQQQGIAIATNTKVTGLSAADTNPNTQGHTVRELTCEVTNSEGVEAITLHAKLIIGADGAMSKVRQLSAIPLWQWDYGHNAIVTTVRTTGVHKKTAWQCFTHDGPLAFLPLANPHLSSIVWSTSVLHAKNLMEMDDEQFKEELASTFEHRLGNVVDIGKRAMFPLRQRHAKHYVQQGIALIGDASHTIHPLAGQGVNLGLLDAAAIVDVLKHGKTRKQHIGSEALLKRFQRDRQKDNLTMSASMQAFKWLFEPQNSAITIARNAGMNFFNKANPLKQHVVKEAMGLSAGLPSLAIRKR